MVKCAWRNGTSVPGRTHSGLLDVFYRPTHGRRHSSGAVRSAASSGTRHATRNELEGMGLVGGLCLCTSRFQLLFVLFRLQLHSGTFHLTYIHASNLKSWAFVSDLRMELQENSVLLRACQARVLIHAENCFGLL